MVICGGIWAQPGFGGPGAAQRIKQYKQEFITEVLALSESDAQKFFPVYEDFEKEKRALRSEMNRMKRGFMAKSDDQLRSDLNNMLNIKAKELELEREYMEKFLSILTPRQVVALYHAENQFRRKLLQRFGEIND